jgi:hypothetical protein
MMANGLAVRSLEGDVGTPAGWENTGCEEHVPPRVGKAMKSGNVPVNPRRTCAEALARILRRVILSSLSLVYFPAQNVFWGEVGR